MTRKARELSSDEKKLWRRVAESVKSRRALPVVDADDTPAPSAAVKTTKPIASPPKPVAVKKPLSPPSDRGGERRVQRGQVDVEGRLDLHGHTQDGALSVLTRFLESAHRREARAVLVITGYGRGGEGVLKKNLPLWISRPPLRAIISGYARAHRSHGGAGAFYVFLKRKSEAR